MMDVLFVVPYVPSRVRVRPYHLIGELRRAGLNVTVFTLWSNDDECREAAELNKLGVEVRAFPMKKVRSLMNSLAALPTPKPLQSVYSWNQQLAQDLVSQVRRRIRDGIDFVVHIEHLRGVQYGLYLQQQLKDDAVPMIWDSVDSISLLFRLASKRSKGLFSKVMTRFELGRTEGYEAALPRRFNRVLVTSHRDRDEFCRLGGCSAEELPIEILPNGVDLDYFYPGEQATRKVDGLVLTGKMSYHANVTMALYLVAEIMPLVWQKRPDVTLTLAGKDPPRELQELALDRRVKVTGSVDDLRPYLRFASVAVAPLVYGVGIQNKVLEAMACSTPVVTTREAVSALAAEPDRHLLVADDALSFASAILRLLDDHGLRRQIGDAGRLYVEENHRWDILTGKLIQIYSEETSACEVEGRRNHQTAGKPAVLSK